MGFKSLFFLCRGQAEKEFKVEVEAIGRVRHKNLVRLLGYCAEGAHRYLPFCTLDYWYLCFSNASWDFSLHSSNFKVPFRPFIWLCYIAELKKIHGCYRMLVYEYVDNGNLEQWLHGDVGPCSPLTWEIRMNIILGTAKGY